MRNSSIRRSRSGGRGESSRLRVLLQPLTHFVADQPASLVVNVAVSEISVAEFHFAALSVRPHEALSHLVGKCFARHGPIANDVDGSASRNSFR